MAYEIFESRNFRASTLAMIAQVNTIIGEYDALGFLLTLRQTFYQCVSRNWIGNTKNDYRKLGEAIKNGQRAGLIDWDAIEDRTRNVRSTLTFDDPADRIRRAALSYSEDLWLGQEYRPEVWIEKDALVGVIEGVCRQFRVAYFSCRGNVSEPEMYAAGKRFEMQLALGLTPVVLHLGDHDPNGLDMTRDIRERLESVRSPAGRSEASRAQLRADPWTPAEFRQGRRPPLRGLRAPVRNRLLGVGRAQPDGHREPDPHRA